MFFPVRILISTPHGFRTSSTCALQHPARHDLSSSSSSSSCSDKVTVGTSNINSVGFGGVSRLFQDLFGSLLVRLPRHLLPPPATTTTTTTAAAATITSEDFVPLSETIQMISVGVVAGLAGASLKGPELQEIFVGLGIERDHIRVCSDVQILLELIPDNPQVNGDPAQAVAGLVLISGTGSVCMGKSLTKKV